MNVRPSMERRIMGYRDGYLHKEAGILQKQDPIMPPSESNKANPRGPSQDDAWQSATSGAYEHPAVLSAQGEQHFNQPREWDPKLKDYMKAYSKGDYWNAAPLLKGALPVVGNDVTEGLRNMADYHYNRPWYSRMFHPIEGRYADEAYKAADKLESYRPLAGLAGAAVALPALAMMLRGGMNMFRGGQRQQAPSPDPATQAAWARYYSGGA